MKIALVITSLVAAFFFVINQLQINNAFEPSLKIRADTTRSFSLPPADTVIVMLPVSNNSWKTVSVTASTTTSNIDHVWFPDELQRKRGYWVVATLITPPETGTYRDAIIFRTTARNTFYGTDMRFEVASNAIRQDTIWIGHDNTRFLQYPDGRIGN